MSVAGYSLETWSRAFPRQVVVRPRALARPTAKRRGDVGILERRNPLPAGTYWVDVFKKDAASFGDWLSRNRASVAVKTTEHFESDPPRDWVLFEVKSPTMWEGPGYPDVATADVKTSADTVQRPPPEKDAAASLSDALSRGGTALSVALVLGAVAIAAVAFTR